MVAGIRHRDGIGPEGDALAVKRMNLLPKELRPKRQRLPFNFSIGRFHELIRRSLAVRRSTAVLGFLAFLVFWQGTAIWRYQFGTRQLRGELEQIRLFTAQLKTQQQALAIRRAELLVRRDQLEARHQSLLQARQPAVPVSAVLAEFVEALPEEVWITKLAFSGDALKIVGASRDTKSVARLMAQLDSSKRFRDTTFSYTQRSTQAPEAPFTFEISTTPILQPGGAA